MAKAKMTTVFYCQSCGYESSKWMGQCPGCKEWNTFVEEKIKTKEAGLGMAGRMKREAEKPSRLSEITLGDEERMTTHMPELDRVLGGGIVPGSLLLVGGDPGIGKSTLLLQVCRYMALDGRKVLY
ncbi:MAG: AAA family ATPase, partial [Lachnospiraceae bacterium]|nr:AAA family ATPase [Lachnospiraceae bacterium]